MQTASMKISDFCKSNRSAISLICSDIMCHAVYCNMSYECSKSYYFLQSMRVGA